MSINFWANNSIAGSLLSLRQEIMLHLVSIRPLNNSMLRQKVLGYSSSEEFSEGSSSTRQKI